MLTAASYAYCILMFLQANCKFVTLEPNVCFTTLCRLAILLNHLNGLEKIMEQNVCFKVISSSHYGATKLAIGSVDVSVDAQP